MLIVEACTSILSAMRTLVAAMLAFSAAILLNPQALMTPAWSFEGVTL